MTPLLDDVYTVLAKQHEPTARQFLAVRDRLALETESQRRFDQMVQPPVTQMATRSCSPLSGLACGFKIGLSSHRTCSQMF